MGWHEKLIEDSEQIRNILHSIHKIAVIGIKDESHPWEAAHSVPAYLRDNGYDIIPVNPKFDTIFGKTCYDSVLDIPEPVDAVLVFRANKYIPYHAKEVLQLNQNPLVFWMQSGIHNMEAAHKLAAAGIKVVQNHCMYMEHLRLGRESYAAVG